MKSYLLKVLLFSFVITFISCTNEKIDLNEPINEPVVGGSSPVEPVVNPVKPKVRPIVKPIVNSGYEAKIMNLINDYREKQGYKRIKPSMFIKSYTDSHNNYMISKGRISHDNYTQRIKPIQKKYGSYYVTENAASNFSNKPEGVVNMWINSRGHKENMLGKKGAKPYTHFYVSATKAKNGTWYYTALFV